MELNRVDIAKPKGYAKKSFSKKIFKFLGSIEVLGILLFWVFVFRNHEMFGGYSRDEMITYLLLGNIFGLISGLILKKIVTSDAINVQKDLLIKNPFKFLLKLLFNDSGKIFIPFLIALFLQIVLMYFFVENIIINLNISYLLIIVTIIIFSFLTESLMFYMFHLIFFWSYDSKDMLMFFKRFKTLLAGGYFPLSMLPLIFTKVSLFLPFAYSFYVPTQLYLKKMTIKEAQTGILIQAIWIIIFYFLIKFIHNKKNSVIKNSL